MTKTEFVCSRNHYAPEDDIIPDGGRTFGDFLITAFTNYDARDTEACLTFNKTHNGQQTQQQQAIWFVTRIPEAWLRLGRGRRRRVQLLSLGPAFVHRAR